MNNVERLVDRFQLVMPQLAPRSSTASVIPLENGIQVIWLDPGFHRGDGKATIPACVQRTVGGWSRSKENNF
jgi:hypothetical protein